MPTIVKTRHLHISSVDLFKRATTYMATLLVQYFEVHCTRKASICHASEYYNQSFVRSRTYSRCHQIRTLWNYIRLDVY